jgi:hypothetical protein
MTIPTSLFLVLCAVGWGCTSANSDKPAPRPAGPGDSLAKLSRRLLDDPKPVMVYQAISCENARLIRLYGSYKADSIAQAVEDTIYTARDRPALHRVESQLANHMFDTDCGHPLGPEQ